MMYSYGFSKQTRRCLFRADGPVEKTEGVIVIASSEFHDISDVECRVDAVRGIMIAPIQKTAEQAIAELVAKRNSLLAAASNRLSILCMVSLRTTSEAALERVSAETEAWNQYCVSLYELDLSDPDHIEWPKQPEVQ